MTIIDFERVAFDLKEELVKKDKVINALWEVAEKVDTWNIDGVPPEDNKLWRMWEESITLDEFIQILTGSDIELPHCPEFQGYHDHFKAEVEDE